MRKLVIAVCSLLFSSLIQAGSITSHTFFTLRPNFQSAMPERVSFFRNDLLDETQGFGGALETVVYGGNMTEEGSMKLARFFLPPGCHTCCLNVKEFNSTKEDCENPATSDDGNPLKDLEARHFNIQTVNETFASRICIKPTQKKIGIGICYKQTLSHKCDGTTGFWFEGSLPIERIENHVKLTETIEDNGGGAVDELGLDNSPRVGTMKEAFAQRNWRFGRIPNKRCRKWGVADIELKFGYNSFNCNTCTINSYIGLVCPTGNHVKGKVVFEPIVGNNHHFGVNFGSSFAFEIWCRRCYTITMYVDGDTRYLMSNRQVRSFDLTGKPWGRYMETYKSSEDAFAAASTLNPNSGTSGINLFTRCVRVNPHFSTNATTGFLLCKQSDCASWMLEVGYNFYARQSEVLELQYDNTLGNSALKGVTGEGFTTLARTIKDNFRCSDTSFAQRYNFLSNCDIDLESASHPATISNMFYGSLAYRWERECPAFLAIGGSYEFTASEVNHTPDRWLAWGKLGITF